MRQEIERFQNITITGRYIYAYVCLKQCISVPLLKELNLILKQFVEMDRKNKWLEKAEEVLPSIVLDTAYGVDDFDFISYSFVIELRDYYSKLSENELDLIESLIDIGASNLFGGFDSKITLKPLGRVIDSTLFLSSSLPKVHIVDNCLIKNGNGWGELVYMDSVIDP